MTEKELSQELLKYAAREPAKEPAPDPRLLAEKILRRDRRHVEGWAVVTMLVWGATVVCTILLVYLWVVYISPKVRYATDHAAVLPAGDWVAIGELFGSIAVAAMLGLHLAVVCTVVLIFASRRATLRQVNANLMEISEQVKQIRRGLEAPSVAK